MVVVAHVAAVAGAVANKNNVKKKRLMKAASRHHAVFSWISTAPGMELSEVSAEEVADSYGMPERVLRQYLEQELGSEQNVQTLPWAILSVILYALVLLSHEGVTESNSLTSAIDFDITQNANFAFSDPLYMGHKNHEDVNSFADFWSWMNRGFIPLTMQAEHAVAESAGYSIGELSKRDRMQYLWHHLVIGPTKLAQTSSRGVGCPNDEVAEVYSLGCSQDVGINLEHKPVMSQGERAEFVEDVSKTRWLYNASQARDVVETLEAGQWLNPRTNRIKVSKMTYHANDDLLLTTHVHFLFARTGRIWKLITHEAMRLKPYHDIASYIWDICFYTQVTFLFAFEAKEVCGILCRRGHVWAGLKEYAGIWNLVDWIYISASYIALGLWIARVLKIMEVERAVLGVEALDGCPSAECEAYFAGLHMLVQEVAAFIDHTRVFNAIVPLVVMLRMFKAFSAQPRLALVTETLRQAWVNLAHYLIVFVPIFASYASMGVAFFGQQSDQFTTMDRAIPTMFTMMLGDFDFADLELAGRGYAFFVFATFMFLIVLVMLSMLIAIIMDVYIEVRESTSSSEPVWVAALDSMRRGWQNMLKQRVNLNTIVAVLHVEDANLLRADSLLDSSNQYFIPALSERQARQLFVEAAEWYASQHSPAVRPRDVKKYTDDVLEHLQPFCHFESGGLHTSLSVAPGMQEQLSMMPSMSMDEDPSGLKSGHVHSAQDLSEEASLKALVEAAELKILAGEGVPVFPESAILLKQATSAALSLL